jgi:lambda family phage portal protein
MIERARPRLPKPRVTWLDRAIALASPAAATERVAARLRFDMTASGYHAARNDRPALRGWNPRPRGADEDALPRLADQRGRAREMHMNTPLARGAVLTTVSNVVGTGLRLTAQPDREALQNAGLTRQQIEAAEGALEREWALATRGKTMDIHRRLTWPEMQELAFTSQLCSGDVFAAFVAAPRGGLFDIAMQLIEADSVGNPHFRANTDLLGDGIEYAPGGMPVAIHVAEYPRMGGMPKKWSRLPIWAPDGAPRVLHLMRADRIGQSRGAPFLAPVMGALKDLEQYTEAELRAAVINACIAIMGQTPDGSSPLAAEAAATGGADATAQPGLRRADIEFVPGMVLEGFLPGEELKAFAGERPVTGFDPFIQAILRQIGAALEIPFEVLIKHFTASYSAARAALLEAWKFFRGRRAWLAAALCQPTYEQVIANAVLRGRLVLPGYMEDALMRAAWLGADWNGDSPGQINPNAEVEAAVARIEGRLSTRTRETAELTGQNWERVARLDAQERAFLAEIGAPLTAEAAATPAAPPPPMPVPDGQPDDGQGDDDEDEERAEQQRAAESMAP